MGIIACGLALAVLWGWVSLLGSPVSPSRLGLKGADEIVLTEQVQTVVVSEAQTFRESFTPSLLPLLPYPTPPCRTPLLPSLSGCRASLLKVWSVDQQHLHHLGAC